MKPVPWRPGAIGLAVFVSGCLSAGPGACSERERDLTNEVEHFGGVSPTPEDHPWGICVATFTVQGDVDAVIEHYTAKLKDTGWVLDSPGAPAPPDAETPDATLMARKGNDSYGVEAYEIGQTGELQVTLRVGGG